MSYTFSCTRFVVFVVYGGALVSAPEYQKRLSKKLNLRGDSMLHLNVLHLKIHLTVQSRGAPNDALSNSHKDAQEDAF